MSNHQAPAGAPSNGSNPANDNARRVAAVVLGAASVLSLFWRPVAELIALVFILFYGLLVWTKDNDETMAWVCMSFLLYLVLNGLFVANHSHQLEVDPRLWIANRLLYVVGIALFGKQLVDMALERWNRPYIALALGFILLYAAFATYYNLHDGRTVQCVGYVEGKCVVKHESWYEVEMLWDDVLMGFALCFLIASTEHVMLSKAKSKLDRSADSAESITH